MRLDGSGWGGALAKQESCHLHQQISFPIFQALLNSISSTPVLSNADEMAVGYPAKADEWVDEDELHMDDDQVAEDIHAK